MSLFQVREWWSTKTEKNEEYSYGALVVGNVDNDASGQVKIVAGSLSGTLRVYFPTQNEFKIEHLLLEESLGAPILQIELGFFLPGQRQLALAVLHPRRVGVYLVEGVGGNGMHASYFKVSRQYEHRLGVDGGHFTAYNMIHGSFGSNASSARSASERDHLCVQSLDGRLQFFEQDRFAFLLPLNNSFVPGPICYASGMDAIVAATSDLQVECYRYLALASASMKKKKNSALDEEEKANSAPRQIHSDWKLNLGEAIVEIRVARCFYQESATAFDIVVLGEATLFCVKPHGEITMQKRLGYHPSTMCFFPRDPSNHSSSAMENMLVASHTKLWALYKDKVLSWSAWASNVPVAMRVAEFGHIEGMIVSLDADGALSVNYLGTDPPSTSVVATDTKEVNYEEMDEEHRQLLNVIRRAQGERRTEPKERVLLRVQVPSILDAVQDRSSGADDFSRRAGSNASEPTTRGVQLTLRVYLTYTGATSVSNVTLSIQAPENVSVNDSSIVIDSIDGRSSTPLIIPIVVRPNTATMPSSLDLVVAAAYTLETGQPRVSQSCVRLPMCMACRLVPPVKSSTFKFTLETNQGPVELTSLFEDMFHQPFCTPEWAKQVVAGSGTNVMSFQYYNGAEATILVSKNAGRYRIQSNELEALWMVSSELVERLKRYFNAENAVAESKDGREDSVGQGVEIFYQEPLPLADFFATIDHHFACRKDKLEVSSEINDRAHQFRVIQKRLLVRYKDRNPSPIQCLDVLLHGTYDQLITLSHRMEEVDAKLRQASNRLGCCVRLILMLIKFRFALDGESARLLEGYLSPSVGDNDMGGADSQGWEERTDAAMTELLRTLLAKQPTQQPKDPAQNVLPTYDLSMADDTKKLKKHITIVCDRLGKGASLSGAPSEPAKGEK